ncbi:hypothetical protein N5853_02110 [Bartonella sp. HY329]|uniref:hypothetical protein n=1 Tax=unclassified Bartonella TaxID=2645622 RepID=UPI0021C955DA|nr:MULTISPECIES: hypothetical protein [unclassified Bartonella]UXM95455.1 hypothetical protein N5853_02110 [Bartonella sp. HY329]UXN09781.1 hypothetical protein N5852_02120 [Bartonella sp. HY328]
MIKINIKFLKKSIIIALLPLALYGCNSLPDATDEQLIEFFSSVDVHGFGDYRDDANEPKVIGKATVECLAALSGASFEDFEAPPKELADLMRATCQSALLNAVNDKNLNVIQFKMKDFESKELTERVYKLRAVSIAAYDRYRVEQNKKEEEQREIKRQEQEKQREIEKQRQLAAENEAKQKAIGELKQARDQYAAFVTSLDTRLPQLRKTCNEHKALTEEYRKVDSTRAATINLMRDDICKSNFAQLKSQANELLSKWNKVKVTGQGTYWRFDKPYLNTLAEDGRINKTMEKLTKEINEMKSKLGR